MSKTNKDEIIVKFYARVDLGEEIMTFPSDYTNEQIEEEWREWRAGEVDSGWYRVEDDDED